MGGNKIREKSQTKGKAATMLDPATQYNAKGLSHSVQKGNGNAASSKALASKMSVSAFEDPNVEVEQDEDDGVPDVLDIDMNIEIAQNVD